MISEGGGGEGVEPSRVGKSPKAYRDLEGQEAVHWTPAGVEKALRHPEQTDPGLH